jgi:predicted nucleotidyltransferase
LSDRYSRSINSENSMTRETAHIALRDFKESLVRAFGPETAVTLFGSTARGDYAPDSDIDILVLLPFQPDTSTEERIFDLAYDVELRLGVVFGIVVHSRAFWDSELARVMPLHKSIDREGIGV